MNSIIHVDLRLQVRELFEIDGNVIGDLLAGSLFYMQCLCQMIYEFENNLVDIVGPAEVEQLMEPVAKEEAEV